MRESLFALIVLSISIVNVSASSSLWDSKECGILIKHINESSSSQNASLSVFDGTQIGNFNEEYSKRAKDGSLAESWGNQTHSFFVATGCTLNVCSEPQLSGRCLKMKSTDNSLRTPQTVLSASCSCPIKKECRCSQIHLKKTICARAYLKNGCSVCNPYYFELTAPNASSFATNLIRDIKVREGCSLFVYEDSDLKGESTEIKGGTTFKGFDRAIGSYECECDPSGFVPKPTVPQIPSPFPLLNVPKTMDEVSSMILGEYGRHPGLMAALTSLKNKRSSKNAYILVVGSTGSGKSSAINLLFDNPNVTRVGGLKSTTKDIHEFRIPIKLGELGIQNAELRVIDTPGLLDTRGAEQDAKFLATLDEYLTHHEELSTRIPNVVLVFHKFDDNRYSGLGAGFVKMLRELDSLRTRIVDETYSNVVFVFSHFCSELPEKQRRPMEKLRSFKSVIESHTQFPKPVVLTVAENKGNDRELPMVNGYYELPNGELYPRNLFEKIQKVTSSCCDPIGAAVIRSAFKDSDDFNTSSVDFPLVSQDHPKVLKYLKIIVDVAIAVEKTEVSQHLSQAYGRMDKSFKKLLPLSSLNTLQQALSIRNIQTLQDVPKTDIAVLELLSSFQRNKAVLILLKTGLKINPPLFPHHVVAGHSFSVFRDSALLKSPFQLGESINSDIGYLFPSTLACVVENQVDDYFSISLKEEDYLLKRLESLGIRGTIPLEKFKGRIKAGFNIQNRQETLNQTHCELSALREFRTFKLVLHDKPKHSEEFNLKLRSLPVFNASDHVNVYKWINFFDEHGTHVVNEVYGGGSIEIKVWSNTTCDGPWASALFQFIDFAEDITLLSGVQDTVETLNRQGVRHVLNFRGGDEAYHTRDLTSMPLEEASTLLKNWKKSLTLNPLILTTKIKLLPLSEVVKSKGQNISSEIQRVTSLLFNSSLKYVPSSKNANYGDRDSVAIVELYSTHNSLLQSYFNESQAARQRYQKRLAELDEETKQSKKRMQQAKDQLVDDFLKDQEMNRINLINDQNTRRDREQVRRQQRMEESIRLKEEARKQRERDDLRRQEIETMERRLREERANLARLRDKRPIVARPFARKRWTGLIG